MLATSEAISPGTLATGFTSSPITYAHALENYRKNTEWWIIFDSFDLKNAQGSALWINERTGIEVENIIVALEGLTMLGLLKKSEHGFEKIKHNMDIPDDGLTKQQKIQEHAVLSRQILNHLGEDSKGSIRHSAFASNINIITELYEKFNQALLEAQEKSRSLKKEEIDNVYLTTYTAVNSVPTLKNGKGASHV